MSGKEPMVRPGGRSARIQAAVHGAVQGLLREVERTELSIPMIAARAGVTPSTIYRRWGDLQELLGDVAVARLQPDGEPGDTGSFHGDLEAWLIQYAEEMASGPGRTMIRDVLANDFDARKGCRCAEFTRSQLALIVDRAARRGEPAADPQTIMDRCVAPVVFRILFDGETPSAAFCRSLVAGLAVSDHQPA